MSAGQRGGILLVDKPSGMTSHDVVGRVRRLAGTRKVGHAGTLDPGATGLLVLGLDSSTRLLTYFVGLDKEYVATIRLGSATTTDDAEGDPLSTADSASLAAVSDDGIRDALAALVGDIDQVPSAVSAIKVDGQRAYARVRAGEDVKLAPRRVTISTIDVLDIRRPDGTAAIDVDVRVECSSGTYIRAIARDAGAALAVGGHLTALRRTRVGPFDVSEAAELAEGIRERALPAAVAAARVYPTIELSSEHARDLAHGRRPRVGELEGATGPVAAVTADGVLTAVIAIEAGVARVLVGFPTEEVSA